MKSNLGNNSLIPEVLYRKDIYLLISTIMSLSLIFDIMTILNRYKVVHCLMYIQVDIANEQKD